MTTYRDVLRHKEMPAIFSAHAVSLVGSVAAEIALSVLIYRRTASPLLASLTLACAFVPQAFSAIVLSGVVDRVPARRLLVACDLLCALLVTGMTVPDAPVAVLLLLAAGIGLVSPLFGGARSAALADMLEGEVWVRARSMMRVLSQSALLLGFAVGGLLLTAVSPRVLLAADALSFVGSAVVLRLGTSHRAARGGGPKRLALGTAGRALRDPRLRPLLLMTWLPSACVSSIDALATPYASPDTTAIGLLLAAAAVGSIVSELLGRRVRHERLVASVSGLGLLLFAFHPAVWLAIPIAVVAMQGGAIGQLLDGRILALLDAEGRGQVLSLQGGLLMGIQGAGIALAGALAEVWPPYAVLAGFGVVDLVCVWTLLRPGSPRDIPAGIAGGSDRKGPGTSEGAVVS
ncbi:MAG: major facilitator superfamily 1 [Frankiales bacterium]|nr:major facilitator superfamily 1 [Frankiales bacterium]